jgi:hypothetical protein
MRTAIAACSERLNAATMEHRFVSPSIFGILTQLRALLHNLNMKHYVSVQIDSLQVLLLFGAAYIACNEGKTQRLQVALQATSAAIEHS